VNRYRFHISDGRVTHLDEEWLLLPSALAAVDEARTLAWALLCDLTGEISDWSDWSVEIVGDQGVRLVLPFEGVLRSGPAEPLIAAEESKRPADLSLRHPGRG
jgi:hypothetical protein